MEETWFKKYPGGYKTECKGYEKCICILSQFIQYFSHQNYHINDIYSARIYFQFINIVLFTE